MKEFKCTECNKTFETYRGFASHMAREHKLTPVQTYMLYHGIKEVPKCACGCGAEVSFRGNSRGFQKYVNGHNSRVNNNFDINREEHKKRSAETQKKNWAEGKYEHYWDKLSKEEQDTRREEIIYKLKNDKERAKKISKALKGVPKSEEQMKQLQKARKEYWSKPENREKARERTTKRLVETNYTKTSKIEELVKNRLKKLKVDFKHQYVLGDKIFDFYLKEYNIVIEVDGDFYHANPNKYNLEELYPIQERNLINDKEKEKILLDNDIKLFRIWESDINNDITIIDEIIKGLK